MFLQNDHFQKSQTFMSSWHWNHSRLEILLISWCQEKRSVSSKQTRTSITLFPVDQLQVIRLLRYNLKCQFWKFSKKFQLGFIFQN